MTAQADASAAARSGDFAARDLARVAQLATETFGVDGNFSYKGLSPSRLHAIEPLIPIKPRRAVAYLSTARSSSGGRGYVLVATAAATRDTYTITRQSDGSIVRSCTVHSGGKSGNGCHSGAW
jgi:hypothetical protein